MINQNRNNNKRKSHALNKAKARGCSVAALPFSFTSTYFDAPVNGKWADHLIFALDNWNTAEAAARYASMMTGGGI
jgi:hypothetical protein